MNFDDVKLRFASTTAHELEKADAWAAVAAILRDASNGPEVLLIKRADHPDDPWSGHMAFPGGRYAPGDESLIDTAVRETREEVGVDLSRIAKKIGQLSDVPAHARGKPTGLVVRAYVFALDDDADIETGRSSSIDVLDSREVAESIWAPIEPMLHGRVDTTRPYLVNGQELELPAFDVDGRIVWGLTYYMLRSFLSRLGDLR